MFIVRLKLKFKNPINMSQVLNTVQGIYEAMEQGNIGKVIAVLEEDFTLHLASSFGGVYHGREGILDVVSKMCSSSSKSKKAVESFIEHGNKIIVLGNIKFHDDETVIAAIPFVDIWKADGDKIMEVQVFYLDAELLGEYLRELEK
jgi:predicted SnoaL-like aldol condensation-catalyzing enzyme